MVRSFYTYMLVFCKFVNKISIQKRYVSGFRHKKYPEIVFGENVVIEAPTASGKTEAFLIPVIQRIKKVSQKSKKYLLLGDMLELGQHSKKLHQSMVAVINRSNIDKVFVKGRNVSFIFNSVLNSKKGRILDSNSQIIDLIKNHFNNNDYLMIKASNATGFNKMVNNLKGLK